jgi:hypothetical protein
MNTREGVTRDKMSDERQRPATYLTYLASSVS